MATNNWKWIGLLLVASIIAAVDSSCSQIPLEDIRLAARASKAIYIKHIPNNVKIPGTNFRVINLVTERINGRKFRAAVAKSGTVTLIGFMGPELNHGLLHDVKYAGKPSTVLKIGGVKVAVLPLIWKVLNAMGPDTLIPGGIVGVHKYIITGHSLGGGLASLFAFYMKLKHPKMWTNPESSLITFGAPRVGDLNYAKSHDILISANRKLRFMNRHDLVPHIPSRKYYEHHSRAIMIQGVRKKNWWGINRWQYKLQVCKRGDNSDGCYANTWYSTSGSHSMSNYEDAILDRPLVIYDKYGNEQKSFDVALCQ